jgi:hypothetical protein
MLRPSPVVAFLLALPALLPAQQRVQSPKEFLGHEIGEDHWLCNYQDLLRWFRAVEKQSDRVKVVEIGKSGYGQPMVMAVITSPANHARMAELRDIDRRLAHATDADAAVARELSEKGRATVWIDAGLHATECIAGQNILELVWQMSSRDDAEVRRILDEVVLLACPVNPDGLDLVADTYMATGKMGIPVLYQRYCGHDNNRDFYAVNTAESQAVSRVHYTDWCPQIVYNHHQTAPPGTIIYTPPFRDPHNYNMDPMVLRGIEIVAAHMHQRFAFEQKPGVVARSLGPYSGWWNGGLRTTNYFHNVIGILTETFGHPDPTPIKPSFDRRLSVGDHPEAVPEQIWHARQTIDYLQTANFAILDYASRYRRELLQGIWRMGRNSIERGSRDCWTVTPKIVEAAKHREDGESAFKDPLLRDARTYLMRPDRGDFGAAVRLVRDLQKSGVEALRATRDFEWQGVRHPAGTLAIKTAQAYRPHVIDLFEPQWHPDDFKDGKPVPPYDAAGWTLAMQFDVAFERSFDDVPGPWERMTDLAERAPATLVNGGGTSLSIDPRDSDAVLVVNQLLQKGEEIWRAPSGAFLLSGPVAEAAALRQGVRVTSGQPGHAGRRLHQPRVGLFDVFGGNMPTGWDLWVLRQYGFPVQQVWGARVAQGDLRRDFDVLLFHTGLPGGRDLQRAAQQRETTPDLGKLAAALPPFEDWSNLADRSVRLTAENSVDQLKQFVEQGGTLIALGGECDKVIHHWNLPVKIGAWVKGEDGQERRTKREEFYIPESVVGIDVDTAHPLAAGMSAHCGAMFDSNRPIFEVTDPEAGIEVVASYRRYDTLMSGWAIGEEHLAGKAAVLSVKVGKGRICLYGADVTYRGQPVGTFKLLFNAILDSVAE